MSFGNGTNCAVYCIALIISWRKYILTSAKRLLYDSQLLFVKSVSIVSPIFISFDKFFFCWKFVHGKSAFLACQEVMFGKTFTI